MTAETSNPPVAVDAFAPWAGEEERELRLRIDKAQDIAARRAAIEKNERARALYEDAASLALAWVYQRIDDLADLQRIRWALCLIFMAAGHISQVEGPDDGEQAR